MFATWHPTRLVRWINLWHMYNDMARDVIDDVACDVTNNVDDAAHFRTGLVGPFFDPLWNQSPLNKPINRWAIKLNPICHTIHQNSSPLNWPIKNWAHQIESNVSSIHQNGHYTSKYIAGQNNRYNLKFTFKRDIPSITFIFHLCFKNQTIVSKI